MLKFLELSILVQVCCVLNMIRFCRLLSLLSFILILFKSVYAQVDSPIIRIRSEVVLVDLLAYDKSGEFIKDLAKDEIEIREDGKPRKLDFFHLVDFSRSAQPRISSSENVTDLKSARQLRRSNPFILLIDLNNFEGGDLIFAQESVRNFFSRSEILESDLFMLFALQDRLVMLSELTEKEEEIVQLVESLRSSVTSISYQDLIEKIAGTFRVLVPAGLGQQAMEQSITEAKLFKMEVRDRISSATQALVDLAEFLEPIPGRKNVLYLSRGYPTNSGSVVYEIMSAFNSGIFPKTLMSAKLGENMDNRTADDIRNCIRQLNGAQVAVYSFGVKSADPGGLANSPSANYIPRSLINRFSSEDQVSSMTFFNRLSNNTTGVSFDRVSFERQIEHVLKEGHRYYLAGFQSKEKKKEGRYTRIEVKTSRPDTRIRYRQGFIHRETEDIEDKIIRAAFQFPKFYEDFPMTLKVNSISGQEVTVGFNLPTKELQFEKSGSQLGCTISVYGLLVDQEGKWVTRGNKYTFAKEFPLSLNQSQLNSLRTVGAPIKFEANPGNYQLVLVIQQQPSGLFATSTTRISIPQ